MDLQQALRWADDNSCPEAVNRMRSRKVAQVLSTTIRAYINWIRKEGEISNTCTYQVLGEVCSYCECSHKPSNTVNI